MQVKMRRFREWCQDNDFGYTTGTKLIKSGKVRAVKVGKLTYITDEADREWKQNLPPYKSKLDLLKDLKQHTVLIKGASHE